jgi:hypothetical protein
MANTINVLTFIAQEMLRQVKNNLQFVKNCAGEDLSGRFMESPKKGETISIRKPVRYVGRTGETYTVEDYTERTVSMAVQTTDGVDITLTNRELMFNIENIKERVVGPAAVTLANIIDRKALQIATQATYNTVGTPATVPTALKTYNQARAKVSWEGAPQDRPHTLLITPDMQVEIVDTLKGVFQSSEQIAKQYESGLMGLAANSKWYECQTNYTHTVGPLGGTPLVNGAAQSGASLITDGWTAAASNRLKKGDVFTIANVLAVNPFTRLSTGSLRQFVVTADVSSDGSGNLTAAISPSIVLTGPYQNVLVGPVDNAALTILGAANAVTPQGLRFHQEAFLFGTFPQPEPGGVEFVKTVTDDQTGISIRFLRDWDTVNNKQLNRFDCVWAFGVAFPEWAARIAS